MVRPVGRIQGQRVVLVPYEKEHVPCYHKWMQDPKLLEDTFSESLSLEEQYELQESWNSDPHKCMFIILEKERMEVPEEELSNVEAMAGDVNIFMNDMEDEKAAEIDIMIAEPRSRGKGLAKEAVQLMIKYAAQHLQISKLRAKISDSNSTSLHLFRSLGFQDVGHSDVFQQATLELVLESQ
ncbi:hypothetical protein R1sor_008563 [Riccia sorocarpa]|uniref:N-acetyltransferase domain-containing protein n=1 Tax=Riccia sorocarpa TaxID=122646 RepID=A0ABD3HWL6_9MARC